MTTLRSILSDHRSGDTLDNQRGNLRIATASQNMANRPKFRKGTSTYYGVRKEGRLFVAEVRANYRTVFRKSFLNPIDAAHARDEATRKQWGDFGVYNFPRAGERSALNDAVVETTSA